MKVIILISALLASTSAMSTPVYKCEKNGVITYTSTPCIPGTGTKIELPELSITSSFKASPNVNNSEINPALPGVIQTNPSEAQKKRESKRVDILQAELSKEEEALAQAEKLLTEQKEVRSGDEKNYNKVLERLKPYEEEIVLRHKNIEALKKEMTMQR